MNGWRAESVSKGRGRRHTEPPAGLPVNLRDRSARYRLCVLAALGVGCLTLTLAAHTSAFAAPPPVKSATPIASASASAGAKAPAKPADKRAAQKLLAQGNQLVGEGDYLGALEKFRGAYDKFASPKILLNIGTTLRQLGRNVEAATVYENYLRDPERDSAREKDVRRVLEEIDAVVGRIVVVVDEPTATLRLDGKQIEPFVAGESRRVDPGEHTLMAEKPGAPPAVQSVVVRPRQEHLITLRFTAPPPAAPPPTNNAAKTLSFAIGGVGAVTLIAGIIVGGVAIGQRDAASQRCYQGGTACDAKGVELDQNAKASATFSTIGIAVGAGALAAGALIWLVAPSPEPTKEASKKAIWVRASPHLAGATLDVGGAF